MGKVQVDAILRLKDVKISPAVFRKISRATAGIGGGAGKASKQFERASRSVGQFGRSVQSAEGNMQGLSKAGRLFLQRMAQFAVLLPAFATLNRSIQGGVKFLVSFEQELANIVRIDIEGLKDRIGDVAEEAFNIGTAFGASADEVVNSIKVFKQAGLDIEQSLENASAAALATQVSTLSLSQAQELLIAVQRQFSKENLSAIDIIDKFSRVEDLAAVGASDLQQALVAGGNAFAAFTKSTSDTVAMIAALREQTRKSGREIGTFFKTLQTRIFAAGDARSAVEALGVTVENLDGTLRPTLQVLNDLRDAFDNLTEAQRATAAKAIAGIRQFEGLAATLASLDRANELTVQASDASGTAFKKLEVVSTTLAFQIKQMIAEFQKLAAAIGEAGIGDFFKDAVATATLFAKALAAGVKSAQDLGVALTPLLALAGLKLGGVIFGGRGGGGRGAAAAGPAPGGREAGAAFGGRFSQFGTGGPGAGARGGELGKLGRVQKRFGVAMKTNTGKLLAFSAALLAAKPIFDGLANAIPDEEMKVFGTELRFATAGLKNVTSSFGQALQTAAIFQAGFRGKAGLIAGSVSIIISSFKSLKNTLDKDREAREREIKVLAANSLERAKGLEFATKVGGSEKLGVDVFNLINDAFVGNKDSVQKAFNDIVKGISKKAGISEAEARNVLGSDKFIKSMLQVGDNLRSVNPEFDRISEQSKVLENAFKSTDGQFGRSIKTIAIFGGILAKIAPENVIKSIGDLVKTFDQLKKAREIKNTLTEFEKLRIEFDKLKLDPFVDSITQLGFAAKLTQIELDKATNEAGQFAGIAGEGIGLLGREKSQAFISKAFKTINDIMFKTGKSAENAGSEIALAFGLSTSEVSGFLKKLLDLRKAMLENAKAQKQIETEIAGANKQLKAAQKSAVEQTRRLRDEILDFGTSVSSVDLKNISDISVNDFKSILDGTSLLSEGLQDAVKSIAGTEIEKASIILEVASQRTQNALKVLADELAIVDGKIQKLSDTENKSIRKVKSLNLEREKTILLSEIEAVKKRGDNETTRATISLLSAKDNRDKKSLAAIKRAEEAQKNFDKVLLESKRGIEEVTKSFEKFTAEFRGDLLDKESNARSQFADAQIGVIDASKSAAEAFRDFRAAIISFNDAMSSAQVESNLFGREIDILTGGISTFQGRLSSLSGAFTDVLRNANISLEQRIALERQLAEETLSFLQRAQQEIVSAGLSVFGQSGAENRALSEGISGLELVAKKLGGSFEDFLSISESGFNALSNEILNLPVELRKKILNALSSLPSTASIGGFSIEQLEQAIGAVGAGVAPEAGILSLEELGDLQVKQLERLQETSIRSTELEAAQTQAAFDQLEIAEEQLDVTKILRDRAEQDLGIIRDGILQQNALLQDAEAIQTELTRQILQAENTNTLEMIRNEATQFESTRAQAGQIGTELNTNINKLIDVQQKILSATSKRDEAVAGITNRAQGFIPNYASSNLSPKEAAGLIRAGQREKRAMPPGAGLAVANTSEAVIPMRNKGYIPNFQEGSAVSAGIESIRGLNTTIVAAIARSITTALSDLDTGGSEDTINELQKITGILTEVQRGIESVSASNQAISTSVADDDTGVRAATQSVDISLTTQQNGTVTVTGLENLQQEIRVAVEDSTQERVDAALAPVFEAIESIVQVLRERSLLTSFGQPG